MKSPARACGLFVFDLDGTLIDSRADITGSINLALTRMHQQPLPESCIADFVGNGLHLLVERSLRESSGHKPENEQILEGIRLFKEEYEKHLLDQTRLFPGVIAGLDRLSWGKFAVVSNKPEGFCRRILEGLGIGHRFDIILGGDSVQKCKPDPEGLLKAMNYFKASASATAMIGDSAVDIQAGKAAGAITCGIPGGFRPPEEILSSGCDLILETLLELADHFRPPE
jgi:phosphoglycolate phosphatase